MWALTLSLVTLLALLPSLASPARRQQPSSAPQPEWSPPSGWRVADASCINEPRSDQRALQGAQFADGAMTIERCIAFCDSRDFVLAGLQYSSECFCGPLLSQYASLEEIDRCYMPCSGDPDRICGGPNAISLYVSTSERAQRLSPDYKSANVILPSGWSDEGCLLDDANNRVLGAESYTGPMTAENCINFCSTFGFPYAGVTTGDVCFCDTERRYDYGAGVCDYWCSADNMVNCGGRISTNVYHNPNLSPFDPGANSYEYRGCYVDPPNWALTEASFISDMMSVEICTAFCGQSLYRYASLGFGNECRCGNELQNGASFERPSDRCTIPCPGDRSANCGGSYAIALYEMLYEEGEGGQVSKRAFRMDL